MGLQPAFVGQNPDLQSSSELTSSLAIKRRLNLRKNIFFAVGEFAINMALVFFSYRLVIVQSGLEGVGVWATLFAWTNLIRLGDAGVTVAATRFLALWNIEKERERIRTYGETALITNIIQFGVLSIVGYVALSPFVGSIVGKEHAAEGVTVLPFMMAGFFLLNLSGTILGILQGLHLGYRRSQLSVLGALIQLLGIFVLVPYYGLTGLALAQILQHSVIMIVGWMLARRIMACGLAPSHFDWGAFRAMLSYSLQAQVVNISNGLFEPLSKILVGHFGGMTTQGLFELAYKTVLLARNLIGSGISATIPAMTALFQENPCMLRKLYSRVFRVSVVSMGLASLMLISLAPVLSGLWLGRVDGDYWLYVSLLSVGFFCNVVGAPAYMIGMASGHLRNNVVIALTVLFLFTTGGYAAGYWYGGNGVVVASAMSVGLGGIFIWLSNRGLLLEKGSSSGSCVSCT